jgi:hypothetical protein
VIILVIQMENAAWLEELGTFPTPAMIVDTKFLAGKCWVHISTVAELMEGLLS